ncbi:MAG: hypothetical protein IPM50_07175 [Acidobacteriota bacterium]|nr:MAG: hypothetical protein IPM50_07175 [Acidobacteriota bacterium]
MTPSRPRQQQNSSRTYYGVSAVILLGILVLFSTAAAQELPKEIRGYKVHRAKVLVEPDPKQSNADQGHSAKPDAVVKVPRPRVVDIGLTGIILEVTTNISPPKQRGKVEFLMFHGITVNGIPLEIEEYRKPFELSGDPSKPLTLPVRAYIRNTDILRAAYRELVDSKEQWKVKGRIFVFGRFKKFGFSFKRVIPVDFDLEVPNPLR